MRPFLFLGLLVFVACGGQRSSFDYGKATVSDLIQQKGRPLREESIPVRDGKVLVFEENEKYQVNGDVVTHAFKDPQGDEKTVLYWKHHFRECETQLKKLPSNHGAHTLPEWEL